MATVTWPHLGYVAVARVRRLTTAHHAFDCYAIGIDGLPTAYCHCSMEIKKKSESNKNVARLSWE